ncbi:hypothetical protein EASAB2608_05475 [Streptomyces sp. EAS-AB2608]|nr:hypothetical protein EASAB2608_05475 [Streptomyces sp. EAS-AB2608]
MPGVGESDRAAGPRRGDGRGDRTGPAHRKARLPDRRALAGTVRVATDDRAVADIAREVVAATGRARTRPA